MVSLDLVLFDRLITEQRDIPLLLNDYRRLAQLVDRLAKTLQLNTADFQ
jgi:hypothetical protein